MYRRSQRWMLIINNRFLSLYDYNFLLVIEKIWNLEEKYVCKHKVGILFNCYIMRNSTNNKIPFFPFIFHKDFFGFILILCLYLLQTHFGISSFSHPDNALEVCGLLTPLHIVPEWYFLCQYAMLKAVPNKNAGFIILLTSIFTFFFFGEIRNLTTLCLLNNNGFSLSSFFLSSLSFLWIGAQFPQEKFLSYGRILTLHYYFLLMCILFSFKILFFSFFLVIGVAIFKKAAFVRHQTRF